MFKLVIVSGPSRGSSFALREGKTTVGRLEGSDIVIKSSRVSKNHCAFFVKEGEVSVVDQKSSNGIFVNGQMVRKKKIRPGDRISVGSTVFELLRASVKSVVPPLGGIPSEIQFEENLPENLGHHPLSSNTSEQVHSNVEDLSVKDRLALYFETYIMPPVYSLNLKNEWRSISVGVFLFFIFVTLAISMYPLLIANNNAIVKEAGKKAQFMAREIVERNTPLIASQQESSTLIGPALKAEGVNYAVLIDLDSRIIAPSEKVNQYLSSGKSAVIVRKAIGKFKKGRESGFVVSSGGDAVVAIEPVKLLDESAGKNIVVAAAVVSVDTSGSKPGMGEIGVTYFQAFIFTSLLAAFLMMVLYRLTLKRFELLNDDLDKVLRGEMDKVTNEFRFSELDSLWELIGSTLQRVPRGGPAETDFAQGAPVSDPIKIEDFLGAFRSLSENPHLSVVVLDREKKVRFMNASFEDLSGVRLEDGEGQEMQQIARDQAFASFWTDLIERADSMGSTEDEFEFAGSPYKFLISVVGSDSVIGYLVSVYKVEAA